MEIIELSVDQRNETGKGAARRLRRDGRVPGVFYSHGEDAISVSIDDREMNSLLRHHGYSSLIKLKSKAKQLNDQHVVIRDLIQHPVRADLIHVDLQGVNLEEEISVNVPIEYTGTPKGEKEGGKPEIRFYELAVLTRADNIPHDITIDISHMEVGDVLHAGDIELPEGVQLDVDDAITLVVLETRREMVTESTAEEDAAGDVEVEGEEAADEEAEGEAEGGESEGDEGGE